MIAVLINLLETKVGVPGKELRLLHGGTDLKGQQSVEQSGIQHGDTVEALLRLIGGVTRKVQTIWNSTEATLVEADMVKQLELVEDHVLHSIKEFLRPQVRYWDFNARIEGC
jgi:hypothetical protein